VSLTLDRELFPSPINGLPVRESATLNIHSHVLTKHSSFFSAQLSERWRQTEQNNDALWKVNEGQAPPPRAFSKSILISAPVQENVLVLQKLYETENSGEETHTFSSCSEALRCLQPTDHLALEGLFADAVKFLSSVPWTTTERQEIQSFLYSSPRAPESLNKRMASLADKQLDTSLLGELFKTAVSESAGGREEARKLIESLATHESFRCESVAQEQEKCLEDLEARLRKHILDHDLGDPNPYVMERIEEGHPLADEELGIAHLEAIFSGAAWLFWKLGRGADIKSRILDLLCEYKKLCDIRPYKLLFLKPFCSTLYLPILQAVRTGRLVLEEDRRRKLLDLWVCLQPKDTVLTSRHASHIAEGIAELLAEFFTVLSTLPLPQQKEVLEPWLPELLRPGSKDGKPCYWDPLFKAWLEELMDPSKSTHPEASTMEVSIGNVNCILFLAQSTF
jgi:hypothetical protein